MHSMSADQRAVTADLLGCEEELWRQRVGALGVLPALLRQLGVDPAPVLTAAGLDASALDVAGNTIPYAAFAKLLDEGARRSGCAHFGLLGGQAWHLSSLGMLGELIRHSATVGDALRTGVVYHHLNSQGGVVFLRQDGAVAEFGYAIYHRVERRANEIYDAVLATLVNFMRELCGAGWVPSEVLVAHAAPADASPYRRLFRCPVRFDAELNALRFGAHWLDQPVAGADRNALRELRRQADALAQPELIDRLRRSLRVLLLKGVASGDAVADMLAMHRRTLNRRLEALGTTFREVLDDVRFDAACELLAATQLPLDDVAAALGYAGVSPFSRAFRRRAGTAPGQWRRDAQAGRVERLQAPAGPSSAAMAAQSPADAR